MLTLWLLLTGVCLVLAAGVFDRLAGGGFTAPDTESARAQTRMSARFGVTEPDVLLLFRSTRHGPTGPQLAHEVRDAVTGPAVAPLATPVSTGPRSTGPRSMPALAADGRSALVPVTVRGSSEEAKRRTLGDLRAALRAPEAVTLAFGGPLAFLQEASARSQQDLVRAEVLAAPLLFALLLMIFRGFAAALLPLLSGSAAVAVGLAALRVASEFTEVSAFAVNLVSMLGLGLAVDYALLVISRFRRERVRCATVSEALSATLRTAGRTVLVSSCVVTAALATLALFPLAFMRSLAIGGCAVVVADAAAALTLLPALLFLLGPRIEGGRPTGRLTGRLTGRPAGKRLRANPRPEYARGALWWRLAVRVARRPVMWLTACTAVLLTMAAPAAHTTFGGITEETLPASSVSRRVSDHVREAFPALQRPSVQALVLLPAPADTTAGRDALGSWLERVSELPSTSRADVTATRHDAALVAVSSSGGPSADLRTVRDVRALEPPPGTDVLVGGNAAVDADTTDALSSRLPLVAGLALAASSVLLLAVFRSVLVPVKTVLTAGLSTFACLGVMTWVFQDGHLAGLLGFTPLGYVETTQPVVVLVVLFALSLDYELFLLSRVREEYLLTGDNSRAVAVGLRDTGSVITGAAGLLLVVIAAFTTSGVIAIKEVGVGLFAGVLIDATLVRMLLVPAALFIAGGANWWPAKAGRSAARTTPGDAGVDSPPALPSPADA
ncbi:MMPL family transporter [Streptomyces sp. NPDC003016]